MSLVRKTSSKYPINRNSKILVSVPHLTPYVQFPSETLESLSKTVEPIL